jgi:WD40 repeat protein
MCSLHWRCLLVAVVVTALPSGQLFSGAAPPPRLDCFGDPLPKGAVSRMGMTQQRHLRHFLVMTAAFSADGKIFATAGPDDIRLWDLATGKLLRLIPDNPQAHGCCSLLFLHDGKQLAGAGDDRISIWDVSTGKRLHELPTNGRGMIGSIDGKLIAAPAKDDSVSIWDAATLKPVAHLPKHAELYLSAWEKNGRGWPAFTKNNAELVMNSGNEVYHWDLAKSTLSAQVKIPISLLDRSALSADGRTLVVIHDKGPVAFWDTVTGKERAKLKVGLSGDDITAFGFTPSGDTLVTAENPWFNQDQCATITFWDTNTGNKCNGVIRPRMRVKSLYCSGDGHKLLLIGDNVVHIWDISKGIWISELDAAISAIESLAFTPDNLSLVACRKDGGVRLWDVASGREVRELGGHRGGCSAVMESPDGGAIISAGSDGYIRVQRADGSKISQIRLGSPRWGVVVALVPSGKKIVSWSYPTYTVWDFATGARLASRHDTAAVSFRQGFGEFVLISPDAQLVVEELHEPTDAPTEGANRGTGSVIREAETGREITRLRYNDDPAELDAFSADGRVLLTHSHLTKAVGDAWFTQGAIHLWELATRNERLTIPYRLMNRWISRVGISPNSQVLAIVWNDNALEFRDAATGKNLATDVGGDAAVKCFAFSPDSKLLATGRADGTILVWQIPTPAVASQRRQGKAARVELWWNDLADGDARRAYAAICQMSRAPADTLRIFRDRLRPAAEAPGEKVRRLIIDLDAGEYAHRETATKELTALRGQARPALREILQSSPSAELRRRIEFILDTRSISGEEIRHVRAVETLERIGNADAQDLLRKLATGMPEAWLTREAQASLRRLTHRD